MESNLVSQTFDASIEVFLSILYMLEKFSTIYIYLTSLAVLSIYITQYVRVRKV